MSKKVLLSGVKPTGRPHLGNYFGAMKQFVELSKDYESYVFIADYHALNFIQNKQEMKENILGVLLDYLAIGLDPKKVTIFKQSDVSEHTELSCIFDTLVTMPYLLISHAFKDQVSKQTIDRIYSEHETLDSYFNSLPKDDSGHVFYDAEMKRIFSGINVGTFNYPVLMASDILLYSPDIVPVGKDQKQHVEYARDIASKFNHTFGETFNLPKEKLVEDSFTENGSMIGTDGHKMSKSRNNTIPLFASDEEIRKAVMSIVTDSGKDGARNVFHIHYPIRKALYPEDQNIGDYFTKLQSENVNNYKGLKEALINDLITFITPMREARKDLEKDLPKALKILEEGGKKAKKVASKKMEEIRKKIGVDVY
jgi:tryptophanyl-tRNA synthetase